MNVYDYVADQNLATLLLALHTKAQSYGFGTLAKKATGDPDFKTTTTINYSIDGKLYTKTAAATIDASAVGSAATNTAQATGTYCAYLVTLDTSANFDIIKGTAAATSALALAGMAACPASRAAIGYILVQNATGSDYVMGTTNTDTANLTITIQEITFPIYGSSAWTAVAP